MSSLDLSNTQNTNIWRESLNREFKSRVESKNAPLSLEEVGKRARGICDSKLENVKSKNLRKSLEKSPEFESLYYGLSHEGNGRVAYLKMRNSKDLRVKNGDKTLTSSQEIGFAPEIQRPSLPTHGLKGYIKKDFYSTTGIF